MSKEKYLGKTFSSNNCGDFVVIDYVHSKNVLVRFINTGFECIVEVSSINTGSVKDKLFPSILGVGVIGDRYPTYKGKSQLKEYTLWSSMLRRCYDTLFNNRNLTYKNCQVSENFKHYQYFYEWCQKQIGFGEDGWDLDKDLISKGNKTYSEDMCLFLPKEINVCFSKCNKARGKSPIGVTLYGSSGKFRASVRDNLTKYNTRNRHLGTFNTQEEAFQAYKKAKEQYIKELAEKWRDQIDPIAYKALMNYEVEIDD